MKCTCGKNLEHRNSSGMCHSCCSSYRATLRNQLPWSQARRERHALLHRTVHRELHQKCGKRTAKLIKQRGTAWWLNYHGDRHLNEEQRRALAERVKTTWMASPERRLATSERMKAQWSDPAFRIASLRAARRSYPSPYKAWVMRSSWEVAFARWLDSLGWKWQYEPTTMHLSTGQNYHPDFWVEELGHYVEIKGPFGRRKVEQAIADGYPVIVVDDIRFTRRVNQ